MSARERDISREAILVGIACFAMAAFVSWLNWDNDFQGSIYRNDYLGLARFFRGEGDLTVFTYPLWGFPAVLALTHYTDFWTVTLQNALASLALAMLYASASRFVRSRGFLALLCIAALPWFALASVKAADIWSAALGVLAMVFLARMFQDGLLRHAVVAALLVGFSLNFRSDYLAFVFGLPVGVLVLAPRYLKPNALNFVVIAAISVACMVPWGLFRVANGEPFGITSTNAGMAMVNSLGFQGNRWGIVSDDRMRRIELNQALGDDVLPHSVEGNAFFQAQWQQAVTEQPAEFIRKVWFNLVTTMKYGFYTVETEPYLEEGDDLRYEVLKEQLKNRFGSRANPVDIEKFREAGLWDDDFSLTDVPGRLWLITVPRIAMIAFSAVYLSILLLALARVTLFDRTRLEEPLLLTCSIAVVFTFALLGLLQNEPRQSNVLYVLGIPLVADLVDRIRNGRVAST